MRPAGDFRLGGFVFRIAVDAEDEAQRNGGECAAEDDEEGLHSVEVGGGKDRARCEHTALPPKLSGLLHAFQRELLPAESVVGILLEVHVVAGGAAGDVPGHVIVHPVELELAVRKRADADFFGRRRWRCCSPRGGCSRRRWTSRRRRRGRGRGRSGSKACSCRRRRFRSAT